MTQPVLRMLARRDDLIWELFSTQEGLKIFQGKTCVPQWSNQHIEVVEAHIQTDATPHKLADACKSIWQFDAHGKIDGEHVKGEIIRKLNAKSAQKFQKKIHNINETELAEICALLRVVPPD